MIEPYLTREMMNRIARQSPSARRVSMARAAQEEWHRCAEDIYYWIDPSRHLVPYVYTKDPKPLHRCRHCPEGAADMIFNKRELHLRGTHNLGAMNEQALRTHFIELDTIRTLIPHDYFRPIIDVWLRDQLVIVEKSRDMMMTWLIVLLYTWDTIFHRGRQNIFQSESAAKTRELVSDKAYLLYDNQPSWLKRVHPVIYSEGASRAGLLSVPTLKNSQIIGFPQGADKVRMFHPTGFFSDEAAFNPSASECFAAVKPAIEGGGRYTAISSANAGWFESVCRDTLGEIGAL